MVNKFFNVNADITGMAQLPGNMMALCDWTSLKLVDLETGQVTSSVQLSSWPHDVCAVPDNQAAVTLPLEGKIQLVDTRAGILITTKIPIRMCCKGICFFQDTFVVSYYGYAQCKVEIVDMTGKVLKEIEKDEAGQTLFSLPLYVAVDEVNGSVFVANASRNSITMINAEFKVIKTIVNKSLQQPRSMVLVDNKHLLVCCEGSNNLVLLNTEKQACRVLLDSDQDIFMPTCATYNSGLGKLFVACRAKKSNEGCLVKVFSVEPRADDVK